MSSTYSPKIVIIGGGAAGLAAADRLFSYGFHKVVVLEAQKRLGGRICSKPFGSGILEFGAQWIHGQEGNPLFEIADKHQLLAEVDLTPENPFGDDQYYTQYGERVDPQLVDEVACVLDNLRESCCNFSCNRNLVAPQSVGDYLWDGFMEYLKQFDHGSKSYLLRKALYSWHEKFELSDNACQSLRSLSARTWGDYINCPGLPLVDVRHSFSYLLDYLKPNVPSSAIYLNKPVKRVIFNRNEHSEHLNPGYVVCDDGDIFEADHVIVTCSLGYLKETAGKMFSPSLPDWKISAINCMGFGTVNKIFLEFEQPFWDTNCFGYQFAWVADEEDNEQSTDKLSECWYRGIYGFDTVRRQANVLQGWIAGRDSEYMETLSENEVGQKCIELLKRFTGRKDIPFPCKVTRTRWHSNKFVRGAYSNKTVLCDLAGVDTEDLLKPIWYYQRQPDDEREMIPFLLFAGEATDANFFSTVHGALQSGWRESDRIAQLYDNNGQHSSSVS